MAFYEYSPFDYFYTPIDELSVMNQEKLDEYGLNYSDVLFYKERMQADRNKWKKKQSSYDVWGFTFQCIASVLIPLILIIIKIYICRFFDIYDEESFANGILTLLFFASIIGLEWLLWKKNTIIEWFDTWVDKRYQIKSQDNLMIEKYLEDNHWEWYKTIANANERTNSNSLV